jgi:hypothetical protein
MALPTLGLLAGRMAPSGERDARMIARDNHSRFLSRRVRKP